MYRLLIVDDEEIITDTLYEVLSTKFENRLEIYKAYSAKEALSLLNGTRIDIVLTDIKMPGKSGIELMHDIIKRWPKTKVVFLTGHSEFEYAYTAIQQTNVKFILKTEHYNVIISTIKAIVRDIDKENELSLIIEHSVIQNTKNILLEQELILKGILYENVNLDIVKFELQTKFDKTNIELRTNEPVILVLGKLNISQESIYGGGQDNIFEPIAKYWNMYMNPQFQYAFVKSGTVDLIWLVQLRDEPNFNDIQLVSKVIEGNLELVQSKLLENNIFISFTITENTVQWNTLNDALNRLRSLQRLMLNENIPLIQIDYSHLHQSDHQLEQSKLLNKVRKFSLLLETGKQDEIKKIFEEIEHTNDQKLLTVPLFTELYYIISLTLLGCINKLSMDEKIDINHLMRLDSHVTTKAAIHYLYHLTTQLFSQINSEEKTRTSLIMSKLCDYIEAHLSEDLSLVKLAEVHYFNPSYLSRLFKQECGINISEYIEQRRMLLAQQLLRDSEQKIRDISIQVGYEAAHSFTRFFKKVTGMTPQDYRDSINF